MAFSLVKSTSAMSLTVPRSSSSASISSSSSTAVAPSSSPARPVRCASSPSLYPSPARLDSLVPSQFRQAAQEASGDDHRASQHHQPSLPADSPPLQDDDLLLPHETLAFVYGTLKRGFGNHWLIQEHLDEGNVRLLGTARTSRPYPLVCGPFQVPFLLHLPGYGKRVEGEVYAVNAKALAALDVLEGTDRGHYVRCDVQLTDLRPEMGFAEGQSLPAVLSAQAYFAGFHYTPGLARAAHIECYDEEAAAEYVPRRHRPAGVPFLSFVHSWIQEKQLLEGVEEKHFMWPLSTVAAYN